MTEDKVLQKVNNVDVSHGTQNHDKNKINGFSESKDEDMVDSSYNASTTTSTGIIHSGTCTSIGVLNSSINANKETVLSKLGGKEMLRIAVDQFYIRLVNDIVLQPYFNTTDIPILKWHQFNFMSIAFSNDNVIPDDFDMSTLILNKHKYLFDMGLNETHFDLMMKHFVDTLHDLNIKDDLINEALYMLSPVRKVFLQGSTLAKAKRNKDKFYQSIQIITVATIVGMGIVRFFRMTHRNI